MPPQEEIPPKVPKPKKPPKDPRPKKPPKKPPKKRPKSKPPVPIRPKPIVSFPPRLGYPSVFPPPAVNPSAFPEISIIARLYSEVEKNYANAKLCYLGEEDKKEKRDNQMQSQTASHSKNMSEYCSHFKIPQANKRKNKESDITQYVPSEKIPKYVPNETTNLVPPILGPLIKKTPKHQFTVVDMKDLIPTKPPMLDSVNHCMPTTCMNGGKDPYCTCTYCMYKFVYKK